MDWNKVHKQQQMARRGTDDWSDVRRLLAPQYRGRGRQRLSKAMMRAEAERAVGEWKTRVLSVSARSS